ncbi:MAG: N-glycosylase/DNA lyase [bacterium]
MVEKGDIAGVVKEIKDLFALKQNEIESRLEEFRAAYQCCENEGIFPELVFCLLTPQSKAKVCWNAVKNLKASGLLLDGNQEQIAKNLRGVRFKNKKAQYIVEARKIFLSELSRFSDTYDMREWLVHNVKGIGYKEASHFLRNIGYGKRLAILDRHILKNLRLLGIIKKIPASLPKKRYLEIEKKVEKFSRGIKIPLDALDLVLWCKETGEIFK